MEREVRSGILCVQKHGGLGVKKFQKRWVALYRRSHHGVSRLEVYDSKDSFEKRSKGVKKHLISLENCATITRGSVPDGKKMDYQIKLTADDNKEQVLQAESDEDMELWYASISSVVFGGGSLTDNMIYQQYEEDGYDAVIKQNEVVKKLDLSGLYRLVVSAEDVELRDKSTKKVVAKWPLHLLRKYGRDKQEFSLEAGRRCVTGPGMFYFITDHYNEIFLEVDKKVRSLADRSRTQSTSSAKAPLTFPGNPPDSPLLTSPVPLSPFPQTEGEYDNPLDSMRRPTEEAIYNEPVNTKPSQKNLKMVTKPGSPKAAARAAMPQPDRAHKKKTGPFGGKKEKKAKTGVKNLPSSPAPPPPLVEEAMYSEALSIGGDVIPTSDSEAYGRLDFEGTTKRLSNASRDGHYDSLNAWKDVNASEDSEYATAGNINQRFSGVSVESDEGVYDHVKR